MKNIIKDIERNCNDKSIEGIVRFLFNNGDISYNSEQHREIYFFYDEAWHLPGWTKTEARAATIELFGISESMFKRIIKKFKRF